VIAGAVANLKRYYDHPEVGQKVADALLAYESRGDDNEATDADTFAVVLNQQMLDVSHDAQLRVRYYVNGVPAEPTGPTAEALAQYREMLEENNCFFSKIEVLPHNIGYLKLDSFADPAICGTTAAKAMASLNDTNAIIFDLRDNAGGYPKMVALVAGYLFEHPTHLNDMYTYGRAESSVEESWTPAPVAGNKLADKPAYVLTSRTTFSGAEEFSYDLKMLKRATIVGEPTSGRGHIPIGRKIDDHFEIRVPDRRPVNPISKTDWDGTGVLPDVQVKASDALEAAVKLAEAKLRKK
jgi:C-terminal processing protease CtpA/Prc